MTKEELEKATGQELIEERNYCGVDGYYGVYLDNVNVEMLKRFNRLAELKQENDKLLDVINNQNVKIADLEKQIEKMKCCYNCKFDSLEPPEVISNGVCVNCIKHSRWELED